MSHFSTAVCLLFLLTSCASIDSDEDPRAAFGVAAADAGEIARHVRLRLAPPDTLAFEDLLGACVAAANQHGVEMEWLCYREAPGRYWLLWFSEDPDDFGLPAQEDVVAALVHHTVGQGPPAELAEAEAQRHALAYEIEWDLVHQQNLAWSTVESMTTATHPMARMMVRTVRRGAEQAFAQALQRRTGFLQEHGYPLPIEGFYTVRGDLRSALQVVFPTDWSSFHGSESFGAFVRGLDAEAQAEYARRKAALLETLERVEFYDGAVARELSH